MSLSAEQKDRRSELGDQNWVMSGLNTSQKEERRKLEWKKWKDEEIEELLEEGDVKVTSINGDGYHGPSDSFNGSLLINYRDEEYELGMDASGRHMIFSATYAPRSEVISLLGEFESKYGLEDFFEERYNADIRRKTL